MAGRRGTPDNQPAFEHSNWWLRRRFLARLQEEAPEIVEAYRDTVYPLEQRLHEVYAVDAPPDPRKARSTAPAK